MIANRGAIACRIIRTLRRLSVSPVAVYSQADAHSLHVSQADKAVCIGEALATETYLDTGRILEAARTTGAQAIHPGYGFLSENAAFAEECEANLEAAWSRIFLPVTGDGNEYDIVVCHGNVIRWFVTRVLEVDPHAWLGMSIANCSMTTVQVRADGSVKLIAFADSGHIPYEMTTYPGTLAPQ